MNMNGLLAIGAMSLFIAMAAVSDVTQSGIRADERTLSGRVVERQQTSSEDKVHGNQKSRHTTFRKRAF